MIMRIGEFIHDNLEPILVQWEVFARTILPASHHDVTSLRDHAREILLATVRDMATAQTAQEQADKSTAHGGDSDHSRQLDRASSQHAISRVEVGLDLMQLVSEYRALRASVVRLWRDSKPVPDHRDLEDLTRFHESMDQSLAKAVQGYSGRVEEARNTFLAILSHDLRSPLSAILISAQVVQTTVEDATLLAIAANMIRSANAMGRMIEDLMKFAASTLGTRIQLARAEMDLLPLCQEVIDETRAGRPDCAIDFSAEGSAQGNWDKYRLREVISNLLTNAVKHGDEDCRIKVTLHGDLKEVRLSVHNGGAPIPADLLPIIFQPMVRARRESARKGAEGLGLGLAIVDRIINAHGGGIEVVSTEQSGTTFTVHLPRRSPSDAAADSGVA
jgi:signal transduction histidine kinase